MLVRFGIFGLLASECVMASYSEAPTFFDCTEIPSSSSHHHDNTVAVEKCPVCRSGKHPLYCIQCVTEGEILSERERLKKGRTYTFEK